MKRLTPLLACCLLLFSCEPETMLTVDQTSLSFTDAGGSSSITLTANKPWSATSNQSWCKVSPSGGEEATGSRIAISCDANTTYDARNATVTITCAELTKQVSISQATNNGLIVSQTSYELTKAAQQLNIQVQANVKFSVEVDNGCKDWVKYNTTKGLTTSTVVLDIAENKTYDNREGKVTIKQEGGNLSSTVTIKQSQLDGLFITTPEYNLSNEKHTITVEVSTNVEFDVKPEADWVKYVQTKGLNTKQIVLQVEENDTYDLRETKVNVKQKNGDLSGVITIKQDEKYGILVTQPEYNLSNEAAVIDVEVKYNVDFDVVIPDECKEWIKQISTKGLDSKIYTFSVAKNETYDNREGSITFKQIDGSSSSTVSVKQDQKDGLFITQSNFELSKEYQIITVEVKTNLNIEVISKANWIKVVDTKGLNTQIISLDIEENDSNELRTGEVIVKQRDGDMFETISIKQYGSQGVIYYTTYDGRIREPKNPEAFDANILSNEYINGLGIIRFDKPLTIIGDSAFEGCMDITSITIPEGVTSIGDNAFSSCMALKEFIIPKSVTSIGEKAFLSCMDLSTITIPEGVTRICDYTFYNCQSLSSIELPASIRSIGSYAFCYCSRLNISLPEGITSIGDHAFQWCHFTTVHIPNSVTSIGDGAFYGCSYLTSFSGKFASPDGVFLTDQGRIIAIAYQAVKGNIIIPESITVIGEGCFAYFDTITEIILPEGLKRIDKDAFHCCSNLTSITIPSSVIQIGEGAFYLCSKLVNVSFDGSGICVQIGKNAFNQCGSITNLNINGDVPCIDEGAFYNCSELANINITGILSRIGKSAFSGCYTLKTNPMKEGLISIGDYAFSYCSSLDGHMHIPESVIEIGENVFYGLKLISFSGKYASQDGLFLIDKGRIIASAAASLHGEIAIPNGVTVIGDGAFYGCHDITSITVPEGVTSIGNSAFEFCGLNSISLPESLTSIGERAFSYSGLSSIVIPKKVDIIPELIFYGCNGLSSITLPDGIQSIGNGSFQFCSSLMKINLPESIVTIKPSAFLGCSNLTDIIIPKNVTVIGTWAFADCSSLNSIIVLPNMPPSLGKEVFDSTNNCPIYVPSLVMDVYKLSDEWKKYANRIQEILE